jgi:chromate transporter
MVVLFAPWIIRFRKHPAVVGFTRGATAAAAGAIVGAAAVIATQVLVDLTTVAIFAVALVAIWSAKLPEPLLVAGAGIVGFIAFALR